LLQRGAGAASPTSLVPTKDCSNYSMAMHARDMRALLHVLAIERCHVYGHSTGGIIGSHLLAMPGKPRGSRSSVIARLMLGSPTHRCDI
jgi:pimeloyl-ACP methyl ester carboxylesterase